jgi:hypothetical protein
MKNPFPNQILEDKIMCHNYNILDSNYVRNQQDSYLEFMYVPQYYKCFKDMDKDNATHYPVDRNAYTNLCDRNIVYRRGENNKPPTNIDKRKNNFLLPYCECNTYDNALMCNSKKCCSRSHQLFENMTRRSRPMVCNRPA